MYKKVGLASVIMMASVFLSRLTGLVREQVIAYIGGIGGGVDAYQVAFIIPEILNHIVASGFLSVTFIPIFSNYLVRNQEEEGWRVFSLIFTGFGSLMLVLITIACVFAGEFIKLFAPGLDDPILMERAIKMTRIIMPAQFFFFSGGLFMAVQFAKEKFLIPALSPLLYNLGIICGGVLLGTRIGMEGFSWGVLAGAFIGNFLVQLWGAKKVGMRFTMAFDFRHPELLTYLRVTLPLMIGLTMTFSTEFLFRFFGSYLPRGNIASLNYGLRTMFMLVGFFGQAVGVASFPFMARLAAENKIPEMNRLMNDTLRYLSLVVPFSVLIMVLRQETVVILFQRGRFDATATALTSQVLVFLMIGAFAFAAQTIVVRGYYAIQNTFFPALYGTVAVLLSIPVFIAGMLKMGTGGVALAISLSAIFQVVLLYVLWNKKSENKDSHRVYRFYLGMILLSMPLGLLLEWFKVTILSGFDSATFGGSLAVSILTALVFVVVLISAGYVLDIQEIRKIWNRILEKIKKYSGYGV
ncbi:MAG: murein biosynthesis integral membrane protein MurJ [Pseudomonadota bacterium]|uniref:Probable lipid II flippase MurJ n=1 Tax=Candidatus Desulfatibia profunda TaxID=2841695 RepID=A0A8J6TL52_9BACT|nr:murein biosynthesis integral membrane protein MurJ [Candidatus Desulfatibia profunda]MBL7180492.1 murein biosynthesis integral membrane protein MurJ [Desulfobacterales bacterium]